MTTTNQGRNIRTPVPASDQKSYWDRIKNLPRQAYLTTWTLIDLGNAEAFYEQIEKDFKDGRIQSWFYREIASQVSHAIAHYYYFQGSNRHARKAEKVPQATEPEYFLKKAIYYFDRTIQALLPTDPSLKTQLCAEVSPSRMRLGDSVKHLTQAARKLSAESLIDDELMLSVVAQRRLDKTLKQCADAAKEESLKLMVEESANWSDIGVQQAQLYQALQKDFDRKNNSDTWATISSILENPAGPVAANPSQSDRDGLFPADRTIQFRGVLNATAAINSFESSNAEYSEKENKVVVELKSSGPDVSLRRTMELFNAIKAQRTLNEGALADERTPCTFLYNGRTYHHVSNSSDIKSDSKKEVKQESKQEARGLLARCEALHDKGKLVINIYLREVKATQDLKEKKDVKVEVSADEKEAKQAKALQEQAEQMQKMAFAKCLLRNVFAQCGIKDDKTHKVPNNESDPLDQIKFGSRPSAAEWRLEDTSVNHAPIQDLKDKSPGGTPFWRKLSQLPQLPQPPQQTTRPRADATAVARRA